MPNVSRSHKANKRPAPLTKCPSGADGVTFATYWYRLPGIDGFFICTKCYKDRLGNTQFAGLFDLFWNEPLPGTRSICDFNSLRVAHILSLVVRLGDTEALFNYAEHRSNIPPCSGVEGTRGGSRSQWFSNPDLPGFIACEACYEDFILATGFAARFMPLPHEHTTHEVWICDLAIPYIKRTFVESAKRNDWYAFVNAVGYRSSIPACESKPVLLSTRKWFRPTRPWAIPKMMICEACYLDRVGSSPVALNFTQVHPNFSEMQSLTYCSFRVKSIKACNDHLLKGNYGRWHHLVNQMVARPSCARGDIEGEWYTLPDSRHPSRDIPNFDVCSACYLGYIEASGYATAFRRVLYEPGTTRDCDFSPASARFPKFMEKLSQMVLTGDVGPLANYAARITQIIQCEGSNNVPHALWWGMDEFFFCAECYEEVGRGSYFASLFAYQAASFPEARCDMYSDNMRRRYLEACQERSLDEFINYCRNREEIWQLLKAETQRHEYAIKMSERSTSQGLMITNYEYGFHEPSNAMIPMPRPEIGRRKISAPVPAHYDHRMTEENLKRAQRKAMKESMQNSPTLVHLRMRWKEVE